MKLSHKLTGGFVAMLAITCVLGGTAVVQLRSVISGSTDLSQKFVPEVDAATDLNRHVNESRLSVRTYGLTGDESYLAKARAELAAIKNDVMPRVDALVDQFPDLDKLKDQMTTLDQAYTELVAGTDATESQIKRQASIRDAMGQKATAAVAALETLQNEQLRLLNKQITDGAEAAALADRVTKVDRLGDARNLLNQARIANFKAQVDRDPEDLKPAIEKLKEVETLGRQLESSFVVQEHKEHAAKLVEAASGYAASVNEFYEAEKALAEVAKRRMAAGEAIAKAADEIAAEGLECTKELATSTTTSLTRATTVVLAGLGVAAVVGVTLAIVITRSITKPVNRIVATLSAGAEQTASAAAQVSGSSQNLASGASEQAASLEETSASIEEMSSMVRKNADTSQEANALAETAKRAVTDGTDAMGKMSSAIADIERASSETAKIIKTIDEIAFQTNLLALNAAVEAARAGEAGKGFAVVAEEVRNLAMRSAEAAKNTSSLIEESVGKAKNGVAIAETVASNLSQIAESTTKVTGLINEIAAASKEQSSGIEQISQAVTQMDQVTQSTAANAEETAAASEELSSQAEQMRLCVTELQSLVGGPKSGLSIAAPAALAAPSTRRAAPAAARQTRQGSSRANPNAPSARDVIPLDGDARKPAAADFSEFSKAA